jgi:hypothetical protein
MKKGDREPNLQSKKEIKICAGVIKRGEDV